MEEIRLEMAHCILEKREQFRHSEHESKCHLRNTGFSQIIGDTLWEVQAWYEGSKNKLFYLKKIIES